MDPLVKNASDPSQIKQAAKLEKWSRDKELNDVRVLLGTPEGRRFFWRYLGLTGLFRTSWDNSSRIHFNEGLRSAGLMLMTDITEANPDALIQMMKEGKDGTLPRGVL